MPHLSGLFFKIFFFFFFFYFFFFFLMATPLRCVDNFIPKRPNHIKHDESFG